MRQLLLILSIICSALQTRATVELQSGFLPSLSWRVGAVGILRADTTLLFGGDYFWIGPLAAFEEVSPQLTDATLGAALRFGHDEYFELQGGYFQRTFTQTGSPTMTGTGFSSSLVYGLHLSPHLGLSIALSAKRINAGTLSERWIVDLLPLFTARFDF